MTGQSLKPCIPRPGQAWSAEQLQVVNPSLERMTAVERVRWALDFLPGRHILTSSFGAQSAIMLHMVSRQAPEIPVVLIDTGYLFPETYRFVDELVDRLNVNLHVVRSALSPGWQEARNGRLWESGVEGIRRYNRINKVEPMERALSELEVGTWFSGLRRSQAESRKDARILQLRGRVVKVHPVVDWTNREVHRYLKRHRLPYHPLWDEGYVSIGDWHTSSPLTVGMSEQATRFFGLVRECGLHEGAGSPEVTG